MNKVFMLDVETMGVNNKEHDILQIGILECIKNNAGSYIPARSFIKLLNTEQTSTDPWILKTHAELLPLCRKTEYESPVEIRAQVLSFFRQCGVDDKPIIMGLNAAGFDVPFMTAKGFFKEGDVHYRVYELTGAFNLAQDVLGIDRRDKLFEAAHAACDWIELPVGKKHDAMYDCYSQIKALNGTIKMLQDKA